MNCTLGPYPHLMFLFLFLNKISFFQTLSEVPCVCAQSCQLFVTLWAVAHQAPLSMGFPRQEYWSGLPFPPAGDLPDPGIKPKSPASPALLAGRSFTTEAPGKPGWSASISHFLMRKFFSVTKFRAIDSWKIFGRVWSNVCGSWQYIYKISVLIRDALALFPASLSNLSRFPRQAFLAKA